MITAFRASRSLLLPLATVCAASTLAHAQVLSVVDPLPGDTGGQCVGVSADGSSLACNSYSFSTTMGFRQTSSGQRDAIGLLNGNGFATAYAVSGNGQILVGNVFDSVGDHAVMWTPNGGLQELAPLPTSTIGAVAYSVSHDGSVVSGASDDAGSVHAVRWTAGGGLQDLGLLPGGTYSQGYALSANGNVVVGFGDSSIGEIGFRWTAQQGLQPLQLLNPLDFSAGYAVSATGAFVAGYSGLTAVRWNASGQPTELGLLEGGFVSSAFAISGSGQIVGGFGDTALGELAATIWTARLGLQDLNDLLPALGVDLTGWQLEVTTGISTDGRTWCGQGVYQGEFRGWVLRLPVTGLSALGWLNGSAQRAGLIN